MARPVKWSRDLHPIRDTVAKSRTETWSRQDIEQLFKVRRASAQALLKAIGKVQTVGAAHFVERHSLLTFLDDMISAGSVDSALRLKRSHAEPPPRPRLLRAQIPHDLRRAMLPDLPANVVLSPGRIEITADSATAMVEALVSLAMVMQNDLARWEKAVSPPPPYRSEQDDEEPILFTETRIHSTPHTEAE